MSSDRLRRELYRLARRLDMSGPLLAGCRGSPIAAGRLRALVGPGVGRRLAHRRRGSRHGGGRAGRYSADDTAAAASSGVAHRSFCSMRRSSLLVRREQDAFRAVVTSPVARRISP